MGAVPGPAAVRVHHATGGGPLKGLRIGAFCVFAVAALVGLAWAHKTATDLMEALVAFAPHSGSESTSQRLGTEFPKWQSEAPLEGPSRFVLNQQHELNIFEHLDAAAAVSRLHLRYLGELGFTLALAGPITLLLVSCILAYTLVSEHIYYYGRTRAARIFHGLTQALDHVIDVLPYVILFLPFLHLALDIYTVSPHSLFLYYAYLAIIFFGAGMFLLPFFLSENRQRFSEAARGGILDLERTMGVPAWRIYVRLIVHKWRGPLLRQVTYACVFVLLFDFSYSFVTRFDQPQMPKTVFQQAGYLFAKQRDAISRQKAAGNGSLQTMATSLAGQPSSDARAAKACPLDQQFVATLSAVQAVAALRAAAERLVDQPLRALYPKERRCFRQLRDAVVLTGREDLPDPRLSGADQDYIVSSAFLEYYFVLDGVSVLFLLALVFLLFDLRDLADDL